MSNPSPWTNSDYIDYLHELRAAQRDGELPAWWEPMEFEQWLSCQPYAYLQGRARPVHPRPLK